MEEILNLDTERLFLKSGDGIFIMCTSNPKIFEVIIIVPM
jgi:hypothetical protein